MQKANAIKRNAGASCVIAAGICWGTIGLFSRGLSALGMTVLQVTFARAFFTMIFAALILVLFDRKGFRVRLRDLWIFVGTGAICIDLFNLCYFYTIDHATLSVAAVLLYTAPCFVVIMSAVFFKERITKKTWIALILSTVGCVFTTGFIGAQLSITLKAAVTGVLSGLFYGLYSIFGKVALKKYRPMTVVFYTFVFATIGLTPFINFMEFAGFVANPNALFNMVSISLISTLAPYVLYSTGLSKMDASKAAILAFIEPLTATVMGMLVFHEALTLQNTTGILLIFAATILLNVKFKHKTDLDLP